MLDSVKRWLKQFFARARTPVQRVGAVGIVVAWVIIVGTAIHWQMDRGFIQTRIEHTPLPKPTEAVSGATWIGSLYGWWLVDDECYRKESSKSNPGNPFLEKAEAQAKCTVKRVPNTLPRQVAYSTFGDYWEALTEDGSYLGYSLTALALAFLGALSYLGYAERLLRWFKSGQF